MRSRLPILFMLVLAPMAACGGEEIASSDEDLTQSGKKLIGEYVEQGEGAFRALVLTGEKVSSNANRFFADIDTGIVCVTTPCPTVVRVEGTFTAGSKTITLKADDAFEAEPFLGKYDYKLKSGKLSLTRKGSTQSLEAVESYCAPETASEDCEATAQDLILPACLGVWTCSAQATCGWKCGESPQSCGGLTGATCADDEFCDYEPEAMCGAGDQTGTCQPRPDACALACPAPEFQVCGCDGEKYCTECDAQAAGVDAVPCNPTEKSCGGLAGLTCADDEFCDYEDDAMCGAADQMGTCKARPTNCPLGCPAPQYQKCGCDGELYCNVCDAQAAGVDVSGATGSCG